MECEFIMDDCVYFEVCYDPACNFSLLYIFSLSFIVFWNGHDSY